MSNQRIIIAFSYLKTLRDIQGNDESSKALQKVISSLESATMPITSGEQAKETLKGIGKKSTSYINSILKNTDPSKCGIYELDNLDLETRNKLLLVHEMIKVHGVGIASAINYYNSGVRDMESFKKAVLTNGTSRQQTGLVNQANFENRIPRNKITTFLEKLQKAFDEYNNHYHIILRFEVGGSYLRGKETSGDIDIILWSLIPHQVANYQYDLITCLKRINLLKDTLSHGSEMFQGVAYLDEEFPAVRIDIKFLNNINEYHYATLYFAGPDLLNRAMREKAKSMGLNLGNNEMTIISTGEHIYVRNQKDIFDLLGFEYKPPSER